MLPAIPEVAGVRGDVDLDTSGDVGAPLVVQMTSDRYFPISEVVWLVVKVEVEVEESEGEITSEGRRFVFVSTLLDIDLNADMPSCIMTALLKQQSVMLCVASAISS